MYEFEDRQIEDALAFAAVRGVSVRVLLNRGYYGGASRHSANNYPVNTPAYEYLASKNTAVRWTPSYFALTHQKSLVIDDTEALILTFNFTPQYYAQDRDFGVIDKDPNDVSAIEAVFNGDWNANGWERAAENPGANGAVPSTAPSDDNLVWSPGSEDALVSLIDGVKRSLKIYNEEMADKPVIQALERSASRGVRVEVIMTNSNSWNRAFRELAAAGVAIRAFAPGAPVYIHAKMILADNETLFLGSENFSATSLNDNRELGIVLNDAAIIDSVERTFADDWQNAPPNAPQNTLP